MALKIEAILGGDGTGFFRMMGQAELATKRLAGAVMGPLKHAIAGAFTLGAIEAFGKSISKIADDAKRLGVTTDFIQEMGFAARQTGREMEDVVKFIEMLNKRRGSAAGAWAQFGINAGMLANSPVETLIAQIGRSIQGQNPQGIVGPLAQIGGRAAGALIPLLQSLDKLKVEAEEAGMIIEATTIAEVKHAEDEFKTLASILRADLAPAIAWAMHVISRGINAVKASGTFWGTFTEKGGWGQVGDILMGGGGIKASKERFKKLFQTFTSSGASSETELEGLNTKTDAAIKALIATLTKPIAPTFELPAAKTRKLTAYSDPLTTVGNFLGGGGAGLTMLAERTNQLLTRNNNLTEHTNELLSEIAGNMIELGLP